MTVDTSVIGKPTGRVARSTVERAPVTAFANALQRRRTRCTATPAPRTTPGFDDVPAPPTFTFATPLLGRVRRATSPPTRPAARQPDAHDHGRRCTRKGALVLHGEQEFAYHRTPVAVGDVLDGDGRRSPTSTRRTPTRATMTFVVMETRVDRRRAGGARS